jgi:NAD(P)-dependent dehydrogenase (short-subunit alcohol dehydrogenase family)
MTSFDLSGRVALVTGASRGIGKGIALGLARAGADVACHGRDAAALNAIVDEITRLGRRAIAIVGDVTDASAATIAVERTECELGPLHLAVNNAGVAGSMTALEMTEAEWQRVMDTNVTGVFRFCQAEAAAMRQHGGGAIVNVASISGSIVNPGLTQTHYNTSKAAVIHMSKSLAMEWVHDGIRVNAVSPGYTLTEMNQRAAVLPMLERFKSQTPMGRLADVDEIVGPTIFLLSDAASFITAHDLVVDGGLTAW